QCLLMTKEGIFLLPWCRSGPSKGLFPDTHQNRVLSNCSKPEFAVLILLTLSLKGEPDLFLDLSVLVRQYSSMLYQSRPKQMWLSLQLVVNVQMRLLRFSRSFQNLMTPVQDASLLSVLQLLQIHQICLWQHVRPLFTRL